MSVLLVAPLPRQDGPAKVTGQAPYAADHFAEDMLYGVVVGAPVPAGRLRAFDAAAALEIPGITHVLTYEQMPKLGDPPLPPAYSVRVPLQDDEVRYEGEPIAIALAETLEAAEYAASLVQADVESRPFAPHPRGSAVMAAARDALASLSKRSGHELGDAPGAGALAAAMRAAGLDELVGAGSSAPRTARTR